MKGGLTSDVRQQIAEQYGSLLAAYTKNEGEAVLARAYELGRDAFSEGLGLLELSTMHHEALATLASVGGVSLSRAALLFSESLSHFELSLRAHRANARLLGLSASIGPPDTEIGRAREQLQTMLDATSALIYIKDADGRYLFVNRQFLLAFDLSSEGVLGKTDEQVLPAPAAAVFWRNDAAVLEARVSKELEETVPFRDGVRTHLALKFPLLDADSAAYAVCCVATDITERKQATEALRSAKQAADEAIRELEAFSYSVAHDLRAPLRSIDGFSHALELDCSDSLSDDGRKCLRYLREAAARMNRLIDDLLSLARVTRSDLTKARVDVSALVRDTVARLQRADPTRAVVVHVQEDVFAQADARLLGIVLDNLIGNAWKFTSKREAAEIHFGRSHEADGLAMFIRDNGAGFDMTYAHRLFGVFQRLHSSSDFEGTGIGLATVQRVIRRHGGKIWAVGAPGDGATFYFTLGDEA
jgi:PAS domain S-box-containing protein